MAGRSPIQPLPTRRRKVSIEIYFVLYLSAIILLLGTTPAQRHDREEELEQAIGELLASNFRVRAERPALIHNIIPASARLDTSGVLLRRDSINIITAQGTFSDVQFQLVSVVDSSSGKSLPVERGRLMRRSDRSAVFQWVASPDDPTGVYRVTVAGIATTVPPTTLRPETRELLTEILRRRGPARDSVTFTVNVFVVTDQSRLTHVIRSENPPLTADTNPAVVASALPFPAGGVLGQGFELNPSDVEVTTAQGRQWNTRITLSGMGTMNDLVLDIPPGVSVRAGTATSVVLTGTAPTTIGRQEVKIQARRKSDNRIAYTSFTLKTVSLPGPPVPTQLFSGQTHQLDFRTEGIESRRMAVEVLVNNQVVVPRSQGQTSFEYRVPESGQVKFVRYLDNQYLDEIQRDVKPLPKPSISNIPVTSRDARDVEIRTVSFGNVNGRQNSARLVIKSGNALEPELLDTDMDDKTMRIVQVWRVRRRDAAEAFRFRMYAIDQRGSKTGKSEEVGFDPIQ